MGTEGHTRPKFITQRSERDFMKRIAEAILVAAFATGCVPRQSESLQTALLPAVIEAVHFAPLPNTTTVAFVETSVDQECSVCITRNSNARIEYLQTYIWEQRSGEVQSRYLIEHADADAAVSAVQAQWEVAIQEQRGFCMAVPTFDSAAAALLEWANEHEVPVIQFLVAESG